MSRAMMDEMIAELRTDIDGDGRAEMLERRGDIGKKAYIPADNAPRQPTPPVVPVAYPAPATGQGEPTRGNGPASKSLSTPPDFP